ncbi:MAG: hypothetical protein OEV91_09795 [Desulfobulbaceae bacterium]|nr:hypothetical protein [Desulfobulbaceae bacterium]
MAEKRMTKMEAVGCLCELKAKIESRIADWELMTQDEDCERRNMVDYYQREIAAASRHVRALEMAGTAMTR